MWPSCGYPRLSDLLTLTFIYKHLSSTPPNIPFSILNVIALIFIHSPASSVASPAILPPPRP